MGTTISRTWFDTLVDDDGSGTTGSIWDKLDVDALLDAIDAIFAGTLAIDGDLIFTASSLIRRNTTDGADSGFLAVTGGGTADPTRGGILTLYGNEHASTGKVVAQVGNVAGSAFTVRRADQSDALAIDGTTGLITLPYGMVKFPAVQNAAVDPNTLDDYEEADWTPVLTFATPGDLALTYGSRIGKVTKCGRMFLVHFYVSTATFTHTTASGNLQITGQPFLGNAALEEIGANLNFQGITKASYTQISPRFNGNTATIDFMASGSGVARSAVTAADTPTGGTMILYGTIIGTENV